MAVTLTLALLLPLFGFIVLFISADKINRFLTGVIGCSTVFLSFLCFCSLFFFDLDLSGAHNVELYNWIPVQGINAPFALHLDALSMLMCLIVTGVGFLIHLYSNGYMEHDTDYARYFAFMNFFIFSMLLLVLAANLLVLFVGWEGVGLASYLLIGFWYERQSAANAATKAFIVNRIGDLGFIIGILLVLYLFGTTDIIAISKMSGSSFPKGDAVLSLVTLLLFAGAVGKSAQIPLHVWLPDAMEGPTPVSALIHAATMVTAGVYLLVRLHSLFIMTPATLEFVGDIAAATALFASLAAVAQRDLKRVLAYSTISQLGLMLLACSVGAFYAAMFHLTTHAFVKALLFLAAGNVIHKLHDVTDMEEMGGLWKKFPITHWLFLIGALALSGIPPLAAAFSKDLILEEELLSGHEFLYYVALAASFLTAFYLTRAYCLTFLGHSRLEEHRWNEIHEAPKIMLIPVAILAVLTILGGWLGFSFTGAPLLNDLLEKNDIALDPHLRGPHMLFSWESLVATVSALIAVASAAVIYTRYVTGAVSRWKFLRNAFYFDQIYDALLVKPLRWVSREINRVIEPGIFEGAVKGLSSLSQGVAWGLQKAQSCQIRSYLAWMIAGLVLLITYLAL